MLRDDGDYTYGDDHADLRIEMANYGLSTGYPIDSFVDIRCACGSDGFEFHSDEEAGVAVRRCGSCRHERFMADSAGFAEEAKLTSHVCICGSSHFQLTAGVHRYRRDDDSLAEEVRWTYIGCRCASCGLVGCYADWKCEHGNYETLLRLM
ncbi:hypothetical protein [Planctomycetes bacterium Pan216]